MTFSPTGGRSSWVPVARPHQEPEVAEVEHSIEELVFDDDALAIEGWDRLTQFVAALIALTDDVVVIDVWSRRYRTGNPYVQLCREDEGALTLESVSSVFLDPPLPVDAINDLREMGWEAPNGAQMPNYSVWLSSEEAAPGRVAGFLVETLRRVYAIRPTDIFNFAPFHLFHGLLRGEYGPEFALNPGLTPAQRARAIRGIEFPRDLAPRM